MKTLKDAFLFVLDYFGGDYEKSLMWFYIPNPMIGQVSPIHMIMCGRTEDLISVLNNVNDGIYP